MVRRGNIHIESEVVGPLPNEPVTRVADVRQLVLEDVVTTRSISVLVEHHSSSCAACLEETEF